MRVLFVSNGHGEIAIADRIAAALHAIDPSIGLEHLALVGDVPARSATDVGPRRRMPSGGLVAMGNLPNIVRDLRAGLVRLTFQQWRFLRARRHTDGLVVAVGDSFALWMALRAGAPVLYVGTAKSMYVAPYGAGERRLLRRAAIVYVRDEATATALRTHGVAAEAPGNVIADLYAMQDDAAAHALVAGFGETIALLPGSRAPAYREALFLVDLFLAVAEHRPGLGAVLSLAPGIDATQMAASLGKRYRIMPSSLSSIPFELERDGRVLLRAWSGELGALLQHAALVIGQAGTANEASAAAGVPVLAVSHHTAGEHGWYRRRQAQLLGEALVVIDEERESAAKQVAALLDDGKRRARLGAIGRTRMGPPGGAQRIAQRIAAFARDAS